MQMFSLTIRTCLCVTLLGAGSSSLYGSSPAVSISTKLQGTLAGKIVTRRLESFVGKVVEFVDNTEELQGKIAQVIVPSPENYLKTGDHSTFRFKFKIDLVQANEPYFQTGETRIIEFKQVKGIGVGGIGNAQLLDSSLLNKVPIARLLAEYKDIEGRLWYEALVEVERGSDGKRREIEEPYVVMLDADRDFAEFVAL